MEAMRSGPIVWPARRDMPLVAMKAPRFSVGAWAFRSEKTLGRLIPCATQNRAAGSMRRGRLGVKATIPRAIAYSTNAVFMRLFSEKRLVRRPSWVEVSADVREAPE